MPSVLTTARGSVTIRPAQMEDAPGYRDLRLEMLRLDPVAFSADLASAESQPSSYWGERLRGLGSSGMIYFAAHDDNLIGMCAVIRRNMPKTRHSADIFSVYVQSEWRGMKIAQALINQAVEWARAQNITILKLAVVNINQPAIRCYERCGFSVYGTEPQAVLYDGRMYDDLLMARVL